MFQVTRRESEPLGTELQEVVAPTWVLGPKLGEHLELITELSLQPRPFFILREGCTKLHLVLKFTILLPQLLGHWDNRHVILPPVGLGYLFIFNFLTELPAPGGVSGS